MIKLFVDDLRKCPEGWHLARTVTEAIRILATQDVSSVSLDHDISHVKEVNGIAHPYACPETFEPVAWYLRAIEFKGPIILHTANPIGAEKMKQILKCACFELIDCLHSDITVSINRPPPDQEIQ